MSEDFRSINGEGRPRLIVEKAQDAWSSFGATTVGATTVQEANGTSYPVVSSDAATDSITVTGTPSWVEGDHILMAGHSGSTPDINGERVITKVIGASQFQINLGFTVGGTGGTAVRTPNFDAVRPGMRVVSGVTRGGDLDVLEVYGRITDIDLATKALTVTEWVGGQPTSGNSYSVNGSVIDLPYCEDLRESFTSDQLIHELTESRLAVEHRDFLYAAELVYSTRMSADDLYTLAPLLQLQKDDRIILVPRVDVPGFQYQVTFDNPIDLSLFGRAGGHEGIVLRFRSIERVTFPIQESGYGFGFGLDYGMQL